MVTEWDIHAIYLDNVKVVTEKEKLTKAGK